MWQDVITSSIAGIIAGISLIFIQIHLEKKKILRNAIKGKRNKGILDENFLIHHLPRKITLEIIFNYFGGPNDVEDLLNGEKIYKYEFENGILKFLIDSNGQSVSSIAFWHTGNYPVKCPNYALKSHKFFGKATFTKDLINIGEDYWTFDRPRLGYSSITCRFDWVELASVSFTYYLLESTQNKDDLLYALISQVSIDYIGSENKVFIHYEEIEQFQHIYE
jgi:hypothetical protein